MLAKMRLTGIVLLVLFGAIQLIQPERTNPSGEVAVGIFADHLQTGRFQLLFDRRFKLVRVQPGLSELGRDMDDNLGSFMPRNGWMPGSIS